MEFNPLSEAQGLTPRGHREEASRGEQVEMFVGTERVKRWLLEQGATELERVESPTKIRFHGSGPLGSIRLTLYGVTPSSLYSGGEFVPLTLRLEAGPSCPEGYDVFAVRHFEGTLWQGGVSGRTRSLVLSGLEPMSPLNRLTPRAIDAFLAWAAELLSPDLARVRAIALRSTVEAVGTLRSWERVSLSWRSALLQGAGPERSLRVKLANDLDQTRIFNQISRREGGRRGPLKVLARYEARAVAASVDLTVDLIQIKRPMASLALDDFLVDVRAIEATAALLPPTWAAIRLTAPSSIELGDARFLQPFAPSMAQGEGRSPTRSNYCCWLTSDAIMSGSFEGLLDEIDRFVATVSAGPYR